MENGNHNKSHETRSVYLQCHILQAVAHYRIHLLPIVPKKQKSVFGQDIG